ncbi:nitronate monooxygenase [Anaplasmataceae bacterium AB001_6]|nr:nitronate monooxygenase [Anaplasmataceae bacterium AB001_6]
MSIFDKVRVSGKFVLPIIEGGKGIAISDGFTCGAFAAAGAVGTFSGVNAKKIDDNGDYIPLVYKGKNRIERHHELIEYSIDSAVVHARIAKSISKGHGAIHMNMLWEQGGMQKQLIAILEKAKGYINGVTAGAGMPFKLAEIANHFGVYYYPIVSSMRAFKILWIRSYSKLSKFLGGVVYEDPWVAAGHNGISNSEDPNKPENPKVRALEIRKFMNSVGLHDVPIIIAGGVWYLREWLDVKEDLKPIVFQVGTRPLLTKESPISDEWKKKLLTIKKGDVALHKFSPTGFYSSAVKNKFLDNLYERADRQIPYSSTKREDFDSEFIYSSRGRSIFIKHEHWNDAKKWQAEGYGMIMKTPNNTVIFVKNDEYENILKDQRDCMGCLSHCKFSNWKDSGDYTTGEKPDPRSFCIQKTLQDIADGKDVENQLMFSGHSAYRFADDNLYDDGNIPTIKELVDTMMQGN